MTERPAQPGPAQTPPVAVRALWLLAPFLLTCLAARILVLLIMTRRLPDLFLHVGGTHVHHLNYGIFLLSFVGTLALLTYLRGRPLKLALAAFGVGLALTFDEFGMWVHLGGGYWQRASFDAVVVVGSALGMVAAAPTLRRFCARHWGVAVVLAIAAIAFGVLLRESLGHAAGRVGPSLQRIEREGPG